MKDFKKRVNKNKIIVGRIIRSIRRAKDITQKELCDTLGVSQAVFAQKIEAGQRHLDISELWELCKVLDISFAEVTERIKEGLQKAENDSEKPNSE